MLEQIDFEIIQDIVRVCSQPGRERRPDRLSRKAYHTGGGSFSCADINERGSYSWFCSAAMLVTCGVDIRADPSPGVWQDLLNRRVDGARCRAYDDWLERRSVWNPSGAAPKPVTARAAPATAGAPQSSHRSRASVPRLDQADVPMRVIQIVIDIRRVAAAIGAASPAMLQWSDYRVNGGRFTRAQMNAVADWGALRAAADAASGLDSVAA